MIRSLNAYIEQTARFLREGTHLTAKKSTKKIHHAGKDLSLVNKIEQVAKLLRSKKD
ncbi:MAG: hypothetical protein V4494_05840 [Chlamydiota bacterium]